MCCAVFGWNRTCDFKPNSHHAFVQFWNHVYDFGPNCIPLSSITIIYHYLFAFRIMCLAIDFFILHSVLAPTTVFLKALRCLDIGQGLFSQKQKHVSNSSQFDWTSLVNKACIILWLKYFFWYKQVMLWGQDNRIRFILPVCGACNVIITSWDTF